MIKSNQVLYVRVFHELSQTACSLLHMYGSSSCMRAVIWQRGKGNLNVHAYTV